MARKERNDIDYFPHSVRHGKKMYYIRQKYANDGYSVWFMLLEELGKANYHYLDLSDNIQMMYLSSNFMISESLLNEIINDLVKLKVFDEDLWHNEMILFNEKFIDNISDAYKKRNNFCIDKNSLVQLLIDKGRLKQGKSNSKQDKSSLKVSDNTQSKLKKTKEKNTKLYKYNEIMDMFNSLCDKLPKVQKISDQRKSTIDARINEYDINTIFEVFSLVSYSNFLNGKNESNWTASFDWILNKKNFLKILEGNYKNKKRNGTKQQGATIEQLAEITSKNFAEEK